MSEKKYSIPNILERLKIDELNEMQTASIKANEEHNDVIILSATGSGKTLAFLLPVLERLDEDKERYTGIDCCTIKRTCIAN